MAAPRRPLPSKKRIEGEPGEFAGGDIDPPRALYPPGQAGDQAYARDLMVARTQAAIEAHQRQALLGEQQRNAALNDPRTGTISADIDPGAVRRTAPQAPPHTGTGYVDDAGREAMIQAAPCRPETREGMMEMRDVPGTVEHEARLWQGGLRGVVPMDDEQPDPNESFADAMKRTSKARDRGRMMI
jgi:hypothetical protein